MSRRAEVVVVGLIVLVVGGLVVVLIGRFQEAQAQEKCWNNLRQIGLGLEHYRQHEQYFPPGTIFNETLTPDRRLSWYVEAWDYVGDPMTELLLNTQAAWDDEDNRKPRQRLRLVITQQETAGDPSWLTCPRGPKMTGSARPSLTHYVGIAGMGVDAALLPVEDHKAGVFGYDRKTRMEDIKDGTSTTLLVVETAKTNGPWTAGGRPTIRGLDPNQGAYLGPHGQFGCGHRGEITNVVFVDGSV